MQVKFFAIRQISTGWFIPAGGKHKGGNTSQEPSENRPPRLFATIKGAHLGLHWWLRGVSCEKFYSGSGPFDEGGGFDIVTEAKPERDVKDFEIVMVKLEVVKVGIRFARAKR